MKTKKYRKKLMDAKRAARSELKDWSQQRFKDRSFLANDSYSRIPYSTPRKMFNYAQPQVIKGAPKASVDLPYLKLFRNEKVKVGEDDDGIF